MWRWLTIAALSTLLASAVGADDQWAAGLADMCAACHGPGGNSPSTVPAIAALDATLVQELLMQFRSGELENTVMGRIVRGLTNAEIEFLGRHFSEQPAIEMQ
ncbi:MAG: hypothetical protein OXB95_01325 [Rhodobacteraceae bacterium]|nr:hypothetical protein [Paracoccaceae bacterium]